MHSETISRRKNRANRDKYIWRNMLEHVLIVERVMGREIRRPIEIHHVDGNGKNNAHSNLVVCPNSAYHALLHMRTEARDACGNPNWRKCCYCRKWDEPSNLAFWTRKTQSTTVIAHRKCANANFAAYKKRNPEWTAQLLTKKRQQYANSPTIRKQIRARQRLYTIKNKAAINEKLRRRYAEDPEFRAKRKAIHKRWFEKRRNAQIGRFDS